VGWDMLGRSPIKFDWNASQEFRLDADGRPILERSNVSLIAATGA